MKTIYTVCVFFIFVQYSVANLSFCPDAPSNDSPCITNSNPPLDMTGGGIHEGTTCCATFDFENLECSAATQGASVWYVYTPSSDDDGYTIDLVPLDNESPMSLEVYSGTSEAGCSGAFTFLKASCNSNFNEMKISNCFAPSEILYVKVSSNESEENCGAFSLTIVPGTCGETADDCIDLSLQNPIEPFTNSDFFIDYYCESGCLDFACPENDDFSGCSEFLEMPTVWFQITVDDLAAQMFTTVEANGNWDPIWSIYSGPDCDNLSIVDFGGSPPCSNGDNNPNLHQTSVFDDEENYWMMITVDPNSLPSSGIDDGSFEVCVATTINTIICLGELEGGACDDESLIMEVTDRELEGEPLDGPFVQGEEVTIYISFFYDATESGADWLIGLVPTFGPGWDLENFDYAANAPVGNGSTSQWYEAGSQLAPILQEDNPILCTYTDDEGNLQLCNQLCAPCSECPQQGMFEGDPLPSGYFWVTNGGNAGCENDGSPGEGWGIGSTTAQIDWEFTLKVKTFDNFDDCFDKNDLSISFQTFSDGIAGCWEDPLGECVLDRAMFSPDWSIVCEAPPSVTGSDIEICHDGDTDILVQTEDGSTLTIIVEVEDNPNVTGENAYTFAGGSGIIQDDLLNLTDDVQIVVYSAYTEDPTILSNGPINEIEVTIYPELKATFPPSYVCEGECVDITPDIVGGKGAPFTYYWSDGDSSNVINVCPLVPTTYNVTVEDALGCSSVGEVVVDVKPAVVFDLPDSINVIKDDDFDPFNPEYVFCIDSIGGSSPFTVIWGVPNGLVGGPNGVFGECFFINESESSGAGVNDGQYFITVTVTDFFGCSFEDSLQVNILGDSIVPIEYKLIYDFYIDENGNGIRDSLENSFAEGAFYLEEDQTIYYNTAAGEDTLILEEGEFNLTYIPATTEDWILTTDSLVNVVLDSVNNCVKAEFGLKRQDLVRDISLDHYLIRRCNTSQPFYMTAKNTGTSVESGILWAELDEYIIPDDLPTSELIDTFIAPNRIGWYFEDLLPGNTIIEKVDVYIPGPPDLPVGWVLNHTIHAELFNNDGTTESWGEKSISGSIQCGYDPNDKAVEPNHENGYTNINQEDLVYKVRFQNTGNAPAIRIEIRDTLSEYLDITSVQYIVGSHDEFLTFSRLEDRILVFEFTNIYLPDSTSDFEGSQGFLLYKVAINDELPEGTQIENTAHIYFDGNPAVVTNTTKNVLYPDLDNDGFYNIEDCDEENAAINPDAEEIPNNDVDEDCDGVALIIDNDMDGFNSDEDCDDENAEINPDAEEVINNEIDENCDDLVVIIDEDMDGFHSDEDCDEENAAINPGAEEIPNNDVDEDCDGLVLIIDVDMDGFNSDEDCDDHNAEINPDAEDIPGNGIDENCDGVDAVIISTEESYFKGIQIFPNPSNDEFNILLDATENLDYIIRNVVGEVIKTGTISKSDGTVSLGDEATGLYLISLHSMDKKHSIYYKLLKI